MELEDDLISELTEMERTIAAKAQALEEKNRALAENALVIQENARVLAEKENVIQENALVIQENARALKETQRIAIEALMKTGLSEKEAQKIIRGAES